MGNPDIAFSYNAGEVKAFTDGDCWELARQIHLASGYTIVTVGAHEDASDWYHAGNRLPDGRIVDIEGIWQEPEWIAYWTESMFLSEFLVCNEWELEPFLADLVVSGIPTPWFKESERSDVYAHEIIQHVTTH